MKEAKQGQSDMAEAPKMKRKSYFKPVLGFLAFVILPTVAAAFYYYAIHADRFVSEFRYSVRGGAMLASSADAGIAGAGSALVFAADSFVLEDYLSSVKAFEDIEKRLPLRRMLAKDGGDPLRRFDLTRPAEDLIEHWRRAVNPRFDAITGITTVDVSFFTPDDSMSVSRALVAELQDIVDGLSKKARDEALAYVNEQFAIATNDLGYARERIEKFRGENRIVTPVETIEIESGILTKLSELLSQKTLELRLLRESTPDSPRIALLEEEIDALAKQIADQYEARGAGDGATMAAQLAEYTALEESYELARDTYLNTFTLKQEAEAQAKLSQAQLVVFVEPRLPRQSTDPNRPLEIAIFFGVVFLIWLAVRIFLAGLTTL